MILVDVNLLIYAVNEDSPQYKKAKAWLETTMAGTETVGLPWIVLLAFLRVTTRPGFFRNPLSQTAAFDLIEAWLEQPCVIIPEPTLRHLQVMRGLLANLGTAGNLTTDAYLAALAIEHRAQLCSTDSDFTRFPGLRSSNPLA